MDVSVSEQTSNVSMDSYVYIAAISPQQKEVDSTKLQENIDRVTTGGRNTVLHLASAAGNLPFIQQIVRLNLQREFIEKANANGNTALHEAALRGHYGVVVELLRCHRSLVDKPNTLNNQTPLFQACEGGHPNIVEKLLEANPSKLLDKSSDGRTCLHAVVNGGHTDLLKYFLNYDKKNWESKMRDLLKEMDGQGNTVLHLAARRNRLDMVKVLLEREPDLSYSVNNDEETAICVALKLGFLPVVTELVKCSPDSIQIGSRNGKNILHLAVELSQVKIVKFLVGNVDLSQLINQPDKAPPKDKMELSLDENVKLIVEKLSQLINQPEEGPQKDNQSGGDTPLHIAARNKNVYMVDLLLKVRGVNKNAVNNAGLTPLDIARENTEYHESFKIIEKLSTYPQRQKPFLYKAPATSLQKQKKAVEIVDKVFADRRNVELVAAALLATMTFTAVFTVPGGFHTNEESEGLVSGCFLSNSTKLTNSTTEDCIPGFFKKNSTKEDVLGMPVLIGYDSFKLFLIFDCVAFYLSLFVVLMWEMTTPLNTGDKMLFMCMTSAVLCTAFAFTAYGLMAAVYSVLASAKTFGWTVLGSSIFIAFCGTGAFFYMAAKFAVSRARFHSLCGVPRLLDDISENIWVGAETYGISDLFRRCEDFFRGLISGEITASKEKRPNECSRGDEDV